MLAYMVFEDFGSQASVCRGSIRLIEAFPKKTTETRRLTLIPVAMMVVRLLASGALSLSDEGRHTLVKDIAFTWRKYQSHDSEWLAVFR